MKKVKLLALPVTLLLAGGLLAGCQGTSPQGPTGLGLNSTTEIFGFEAMSAVHFLDQTSFTPSARRQAITEDEKTEVLEYLTLAEQLLAGEKPITIVEGTSELSRYEHKMTLTARDLSGQNYEYVMYYNETVEIDDDDDDDDDHDDHDDEEVESILDGIMLAGDVSYTLRGEKEVEAGEMETKLTAWLDETHYIIVEQEIEADEVEFAYTVVDGQNRSSFAIEIENEDHEKEVVIKSNENGLKKKIKFAYLGSDELGRERIRVKMEIDNTEKIFFIYVSLDAETGLPVYEFVEA